jgi:hypothetical protein
MEMAPLDVSSSTRSLDVDTSIQHGDRGTRQACGH